MPYPDLVPSSADERRRQFTASLPMRTALLAVAAVWLLGAVWSYTEQSAFAANKGFAFPHLLPLVIDGFAIAMAGVAWAASLDARPAVAARLATVVAVCASSASNGAWAYIRTQRDLVAVVLGVAVPIAANLAFEVLLAELRRQVQRRRGLPPPVAIPYPRLIRLGLAPWRTFVEWRAMVLDLTAMEHTVAARPATVEVAEPARPVHTEPPGPAAPVVRAEAAVHAEPVVHPERSVESPPPAVGARHVEAAAGTNGTAASANGTANGTQAGRAVVNGTATRPDPTTSSRRNGNGSGAERRPVDSRVEMLAAHLAATEDSGEFTGEMVGPLLGIEVAPRTGRRLLGQARELVAERARAEADQHDSGLTVIGAG